MKAKLYSALLLCFALFTSIAVYSQATTYLFIGSYTNGKPGKGIYVYSFNTSNGQLKKVCSANNVTNPSYITLSHDGKFVYACTETLRSDAGSMSSFSFDDKKGALTFINKQANGVNPVYAIVDASNRWLISANYTIGAVSFFSINKDGSLAPFSKITQFDGKSINKERQERSHIHSIVFSPDQHYIFLPDLGADRIWRFRFDPTKDPPVSDTSIADTRAVPGSGPRHFVFHPYLSYAYCIEELSGTVQAYAYTDGRLNTIQRIAAHYKKHKGDHSSADIHISPDGRFLYASNRGEENNIATFSIDRYTGKLKLIGIQSTSGDHPRNFIIDPDGRFLLVANQISGDVVVFKRNLQTGLLIKTGIKIKVPGASCLQIHSY